MKTKKFEFSKLVMAGMMTTYFIGLAFGIWAIFKLFAYNPETIYMALGGLFTYVAAPVSIAAAFYSNKAKAENLLKIQNAQDREFIAQQFNDNSAIYNNVDSNYDAINQNLSGVSNENLVDYSGGVG